MRPKVPLSSWGTTPDYTASNNGASSGCRVFVQRTILSQAVQCTVQLCLCASRRGLGFWSSAKVSAGAGGSSSFLARFPSTNHPRLQAIFTLIVLRAESPRFAPDSGHGLGLHPIDGLLLPQSPCWHGAITKVPFNQPVEYLIHRTHHHHRITIADIGGYFQPGLRGGVIGFGFRGLVLA